MSQLREKLARLRASVRNVREAMVLNKAHAAELALADALKWMEEVTEILQPERKPND